MTHIQDYTQIQRMIALPSNDSNANKTEQQSVVKLIFLQTQQAMLIVCIPNIVIIHRRKMHVFSTIYVFKQQKLSSKYYQQQSIARVQNYTDITISNSFFSFFFFVFLSYCPDITEGSPVSKVTLSVQNSKVSLSAVCKSCQASYLSKEQRAVPKNQKS